MTTIQERVDEARAQERARIAEWLRAKALEVERMITLAAERHAPDTAIWTKAMATRTATLLRVLAGFIENDTLFLKEGP